MLTKLFCPNFNYQRFEYKHTLLSTDGERQTSPSLNNTWDDDEDSSDSFSPDGDVIDTLCLAQDKTVIHSALDTVAKVVSGEVMLTLLP